MLKLLKEGDFAMLSKELILCLITAIAGYFVGKWHQLFIERRTALSLRFQNLYAPFEKLIWLNTQGAHTFSGLNRQLQREFFELLLNNYEYADSELKELIFRFKCTYDNSETDMDEADQYFFLIEKRIDQIFNTISKKLFYEPYCIKYAKKVTKDWERLL